MASRRRFSGACQPVLDDPARHRLLPPCGEWQDSGVWMSHKFPGADEGEGRVGLMYRGQSDMLEEGEAFGYCALHDCRSGARWGFDKRFRAGPPLIPSLRGLRG